MSRPARVSPSCCRQATSASIHSFIPHQPPCRLRRRMRRPGASRSCVSRLAGVDRCGSTSRSRRLDVAALIGSLDPMTTIYACGPARFVEAVEASAGGHPLHIEHFEAKPLAAPVFDGEVDHRDSILTPLEQQQNAVMYICVSRAACQRLVLEL